MKADIQLVSSKNARHILYKGKRYILESDAPDNEIVAELKRIRAALERKKRKKRKKVRKIYSDNPLKAYGISKETQRITAEIAKVKKLNELSRAIEAPVKEEAKKETPKSIPPTRALPQPPVEEIDSSDDDDDIVQVPFKDSDGKTTTENLSRRVVNAGKALAGKELENRVRVLLTTPRVYEGFLEERDVYNIPPGIRNKQDVINFLVKNMDHDILLGETQLMIEHLRGNGEKMHTKDGLWKHQIERYMSGMDEFLGVFSLMNLHTLKLPRKGVRRGALKKSYEHNSFILNIGYHWVGVRIDDETIEYYDSEASQPPDEFMEILRPILKKTYPDSVFQFKVSSVVCQDKRSSSCGYHAMRFLVDRYRGLSFKDATFFSTVDRSIKGEKEAKRFKEQLQDFSVINF